MREKYFRVGGRRIGKNQILKIHATNLFPRRELGAQHWLALTPHLRWYQQTHGGTNSTTIFRNWGMTSRPGNRTGSSRPRGQVSVRQSNHVFKLIRQSLHRDASSTTCQHKEPSHGGHWWTLRANVLGFQLVGGHPVARFFKIVWSGRSRH